jgi:hypothetical protein
VLNDSSGEIRGGSSAYKRISVSYAKRGEGKAHTTHISRADFLSVEDVKGGGGNCVGGSVQPIFFVRR